MAMPRLIPAALDDYSGTRDAYSRLGVNARRGFGDRLELFGQLEIPLDTANLRIQAIVAIPARATAACTASPPAIAPAACGWRPNSKPSGAATGRRAASTATAIAPSTCSPATPWAGTPSS